MRWMERNAGRVEGLDDGKAGVCDGRDGVCGANAFEGGTVVVLVGAELGGGAGRVAGKGRGGGVDGLEEREGGR